jgi:hypothetical protein
MNNKKSLKDKIIQSVFVYETKKTAAESIFKIITFLILIGIILVFGGVITDIFIESEFGSLISDFIKAKEYSYSKFTELGTVLFGEIPQWVLGFYIVGLILGCILIVSIIRNRKSILHKFNSIVRYWFKQ